MSGLEGDWGAALDQQESELSGKVRPEEPRQLVMRALCVCV